LPAAIVAILLFGIVGAVLLRVTANEKAHSVLLKWSPPAPKPDSTVVGYNIYRSLPDGSFGFLAYVVAPTYVDTKVTRGTTYYYYVKTVDAAGHESPPSNNTSVKVP
jgi:fibronectin type 3 domain-containing protein